ncbi:P-loop containing nucleoside triphosphate hydrolase [Gracilaria domingensis]|nr:P-loop containing nucleoside triphosphate hydrolase [Gracilaria domingensis]
MHESNRSKHGVHNVNPIRVATIVFALFVVLMTLRDSGTRLEDVLGHSESTKISSFWDESERESSGLEGTTRDELEENTEDNTKDNANSLPHENAEELTPVDARTFRLNEVDEGNAQDSPIDYRPPPCKHSEPGRQNFLMVFMGHSASSAILSELRQHSRFFISVPEPIDHPPYEFNTQLGLQYADEFFQNSSSTGKIAGFKMRPWHILHAPDEWKALVKRHNIRLIWQYRINVFKQAVGEYTAKYMNDSSAVEGIDHTMSEEDRCKIGVGCQFRIDNVSQLHDLMVNFIENNRQIQDAVHLLSDPNEEEQCVLPVTYEDYLYYRETTMHKLMTFLDVDFENHAPFRKKATSDNMCYALLNFHDEICDAFFRCSKWRSMLHDPRNSCTCSLSKRSGPSSSSLFCPQVG